MQWHLAKSGIDFERLHTHILIVKHTQKHTAFIVYELSGRIETMCSNGNYASRIGCVRCIWVKKVAAGPRNIYFAQVQTDAAGEICFSLALYKYKMVKWLGVCECSAFRETGNHITKRFYVEAKQTMT